MKNESFQEILWWPPWAPVGVTNWGWGTSGKKGYFLSSVFKCFVKFHPNIVGNLIMGRGGFFIKWCPWPPWRPRGPQGANSKKIQTFSLLDLEAEQSSYVVCRYLVKSKSCLLQNLGGPLGPMRLKIDLSD